MSSTIAVDDTHDPVAPDEIVTLAISEVAERTGVTEHTLRYYERIGLLDVGRDTGGRRRYTDQDIARVVFVSRLRSSEMPIRDLQRYVELVHDGPATEPQRLAILQAHRERVLERQAELEAALRIIDFKIDVYGGSCGT
jgi:DNA-binding transcriptional MerR regulator